MAPISQAVMSKTMVLVWRSPRREHPRRQRSGPATLSPLHGLILLAAARVGKEGAVQAEEPRPPCERQQSVSQNKAAPKAENVISARTGER